MLRLLFIKKLSKVRRYLIIYIYQIQISNQKLTNLIANKQNNNNLNF